MVFSNPYIGEIQLFFPLLRTAMSDTQTTNAPYKAEGRSRDSASGPFRTEDWWAVWIGLGIIVVAYLLFASGTSIKGLAVAPAKWSSGAQAVTDLGHHLPNYIALFIVFAILFGIAVAALGQQVALFVPGFVDRKSTRLNSSHI